MQDNERLAIVEVKLDTVIYNLNDTNEKLDEYGKKTDEMAGELKAIRLLLTAPQNPLMSTVSPRMKRGLKISGIMGIVATMLIVFFEHVLDKLL